MKEFGGTDFFLQLEASCIFLSFRRFWGRWVLWPDSDVLSATLRQPFIHRWVNKIEGDHVACFFLEKSFK